MTDEEIAQIRDAAKEYARMQVTEAVERIERDDRVPVLQAVCDDRRLRVRDAANRRLWILSTRGEPAKPEVSEPPKRSRAKR
jgi:hypothetical protein